MRIRKIHLSMISVCLTLILSGCASMGFSNQQKESLEMVTKLRDNFKVQGFEPKPVVEGNWNFETGGTPNATFTAVGDSKLTKQEACTKADEYSKSISKSEITFFPRSGIREDHGIVSCIAEFLANYTDGFRWNGTLASGAKFKVILRSNHGFSLDISTNFDTPAGSEEEMGLALVPEDPAVVQYFDELQSYRTTHRINLYTLSSLAEASLPAKSDSAEMTPIVDGDGYIRKISVKYLKNNWSDSCRSVMPWNEKIWGIKDPGPSYPTYFVTSLKKLDNFGSELSDSNCK